MTTYNLILDDDFLNELKKLDKYVQKCVFKYLKEIEKLENPRARGKALTGNLKGLWRYRVENYKLIREIKDNELIIIAISIGHRSVNTKGWRDKNDNFKLS